MIVHEQLQFMVGPASTAVATPSAQALLPRRAATTPTAGAEVDRVAGVASSSSLLLYLRPREEPQPGQPEPAQGLAASIL
jgi:hypothetical protein